MKKTAKLFLLLAALSALICAFTLTASADNAKSTETSTVGQYTAPEGSWVPDADHAGITYGVWEGTSAEIAESSFKANNPPDFWSTSTTITAAEISGKTGMHIYVHLFADNLSHEDIIIYDWSSLTINLAGHTLKTTKTIAVGGDTTTGNRNGVQLTLKNGTSYSSYPGTIKTNLNTVAYYTNVKFEIVKNNYEALFIDSGAKLMNFDSCYINFTGANGGMSIVGTSSMSGSNLNFINTHIEQPNAAATTPFINFGPTTDRTTEYNIRFDKDSSMNRSSDYLINVWRNADTTASKVNVFFEEGFKCTNKSLPPMTYQVASRGAAGTVYNCTSSSIVKMYVVAPGASTSVGDWRAFMQSDGTYALGSFSAKAAEHSSSDDRIVFNVWNDTTIGTAGAYLDSSINGWGVLRLYDNITLNTKGTNKHLTIDLNGHTLKLTERFEIGSNGSAWRSEVVKFISSAEAPGNLDLSAIANEKFFARPGKYIYFDNLSINFKGILLNDSAGLRVASFKNCTLLGEGTVIANYGINSNLADLNTWIASGNYRTYTFENTSIADAAPVYTSNIQVKDNLRVTVTNGCVINAASSIARLAENATGVNLAVNIDLDTKYTGFMPKAAHVDGDNTAVPTVNYINGSETVNIADYAIRAEGEYFVYVAKPTVPAGVLQANLTLYTDFNLNFFASSAVKGAYYASKALEPIDFDGRSKYVIEGISADKAADDISLVFVIEMDGTDYYINLTYSVLTYANSVIAKDDLSDLSKKLVTSAMEYVKAAYTYTGKTAPAFTGVALTAATAPATTAATLPELIAGARLSLGENLKLRFTLAEGKSGNLTVGDASYVVENGKVGEVGYVEVDMRAYLFFDAEIVVSDGTTTGTYTLAHYVNAVKGNADANLVDLVNDFYTYTKYASEYKKTGSLN